MATKLKVKNELFREWGEFFMCPAYQQFVQLGFCASRFQKSSDPACGFDACKR